MNEAALLASLGLVTIAAIVIVLFDCLVYRITSPDPENEDWPA